MVRRSQLSEEDEENRLEMVNFICEYSSRCAQDLTICPWFEKRIRSLS